MESDFQDISIIEVLNIKEKMSEAAINRSATFNTARYELLTEALYKQF